MRFRDLHIQTQREAPSNARTEGFAFLVRAGYLARSGEPLPLGALTIERLNKLAHRSPSSFLSQLAIPVLNSASETYFPIPTGSVSIMHCASCGYAARSELAVFRKPAPPAEDLLPLEKVATPGCNTIESLANFLGIPAERTAKAMMFTRPADGRFMIAVLRGDMALSQHKLANAAGEARLANAEEVSAAGAAAGYASPVGLKGALAVVDDLIPGSRNLAAGANEEGYHLLNTNHGRDYQADLVADLAMAAEGDPCVNCGEPLADLNAEPLVTAGEVQVEQVLRALAEVHHDPKGLCLPPGAGPFDVYLMHVPGKQIDTHARAEELYTTLHAAGIDVLFDDRAERAGVKFNDADLIGPPLRVTVGEKNIVNGMIEMKPRTSDTQQLVPVEQLLAAIRTALSDPPRSF